MDLLKNTALGALIAVAGCSAIGLAYFGLKIFAGLVLGLVM